MMAGHLVMRTVEHWALSLAEMMAPKKAAQTDSVFRLVVMSASLTLKAALKAAHSAY